MMTREVEVNGIVVVTTPIEITPTDPRSIEDYLLPQFLLNGISGDILHAADSQDFLYIFDKPNRMYNMDGHPHYVWVVTYRGLTFHVQTGTSGTTCNVDLKAGDAATHSEKEIGQLVAMFLTDLTDALVTTPGFRK